MQRSAPAPRGNDLIPYCKKYILCNYKFTKFHVHFTRFPNVIPAKRINPSHLFALNFAKQSEGVSNLTVPI